MTGGSAALPMSYAPGRTVVARFRQMAASFPDHLAVADEAGQLTYRQLDARSDQLAGAILARAGRASEPVALALGHTVDFVVALLAVLKADKFYLSLAVEGKPAQLRAILDAADRPLVITTQSHLPAIAAAGESELCLLDRPDVWEHTFQAGALPATGEDLLNLTFTSGSTGAPKGVLQAQANLWQYIRHAIPEWQYGAGDRFGLVMPFTTNPAAAMVFEALLSGAALLLFELRRRSLAELRRWLHTERITVTHLVPTVFRQWMALLDAGETYTDMRLLKFGGEPCLRRDFELFQRHFGAHCSLRNGYGTSEAFLIAGYRLTPDMAVTDAVVPVGYPAPGQEIRILGEGKTPLPPGQAGQVAVVSQYLPPGYWRDPALTAAVFPPTGDGWTRTYLTGDLGRVDGQGRLQHLGRLDDMVKIGGQRVELGCVELALLECHQIREAVVVDRPTVAGDSRLVAYVVPAPGRQLAASALRQELSAKLDAPMIPSLFVQMDALPLLPLGKVNRQALPPVGSARPHLGIPFVAPRTPFEQLVAGIWRDVLGLDEVGVHDAFLELGGNSLQAMRIAARLHQVLSVELPQAEFMAAATVAQMAAALLDRLAATADPAELERFLN